MDDLLAAAIEGGLKIMLGIFVFLAAPVIVLYYAFKAVMWLFGELDKLFNSLLNELERLFFYYGAHLLLVVVGLAVVYIVGGFIKDWWEIHKIEATKRRALRRLDALYEQTAEQMDKLGGTS